MKEIKIKYHYDNVQKISKIEQGDWIDLRAAKTYNLYPGKYYSIDLGVSMKLPKGYEAHIVPRSSSFRNWGFLQVNSMAIIDHFVDLMMFGDYLFMLHAKQLLNAMKEFVNLE